MSSAQERTTRRSDLNATYVPVKTMPDADPDTDQILSQYDYNRADQLLKRLKIRGTGGPYLVASKRPLDETVAEPRTAASTKEQAEATRILVMDGSWAPASTIRFWMDAFINQGSQEHFAQRRALDRFNLSLRTMISVFAEEIPRAAGSIVTISGK